MNIPHTIKKCWRGTQKDLSRLQRGGNTEIRPFVGVARGIVAGFLLIVFGIII